MSANTQTPLQMKLKIAKLVTGLGLAAMASLAAAQAAKPNVVILATGGTGLVIGFVAGVYLVGLKPRPNQSLPRRPFRRIDRMGIEEVHRRDCREDQDQGHRAADKGQIHAALRAYPSLDPKVSRHE